VETTTPPFSPPPSRPTPPNALLFFAVVLLLYALPGQIAQASNVVLGLAWTEIFVFLLPAAVFAAGANLRPNAFLLLARRPTVAQILLGLACGVVSFAAAGALMSLSSLLLPRSWIETFDLARLFRGPPGERILLGLVATTLAPFCEEAAFRGYLQNALLHRRSGRAAIVISALLFAAMHLDPTRFAAVFVLGLLYGWIAWRTGTIWPSVVAHAANNGIAATLTLASLAETSPDAATPRAAGLMLITAGVLLVPLVRALRVVTPAPLVPQEVAVPYDPADQAVGFRLARISPSMAGMAALGAALLVFITTLSRTRGN
jgi:uncharacterized protein